MKHILEILTSADNLELIAYAPFALFALAAILTVLGVIPVSVWGVR